MISVQKEDFDVAFEMQKLTDGRTDIGAVVTFTGLVRELAGNKKITSMRLEHYPGMTESELERIEKQARKRWKLLDSRVIHRYGDLLPAEQIVLVITLSTHRKDAFEAAEFLMDYLKTSAPFWKKETLADGSKWVEAKSDDEQATKRWFTDDKE